MRKLMGILLVLVLLVTFSVGAFAAGFEKTAPPVRHGLSWTVRQLPLIMPTSMSNYIVGCSGPKPSLMFIGRSGSY